MRVLIVDDEEIKRVSLVDDLTAAGHSAAAVGGGDEALERIAEDAFDLVVTDLRMPEMDGMELLRRIKALPAPRPEVILMTAYGNIPVAVEAMKVGAFDFITKPFRNDAIFPLMARVAELRHLPEAISQAAETSASEIDSRIVGPSPVMQEVRKMVRICARTDTTVLLSGETGTGKDLVATTIHSLSVRHSAPFVKVNCAVFPDHLIERELYGHEKGAFTGADRRSKGKLDLAQGGTLFLDDVDDIPLEHQVKLLRVIEEKVFEPLGSLDVVPADVKIIAATKANLLPSIEAGMFRSDLYYRLNILRIDLPPLREHLEDIPALAQALLHRIAGGRTHHIEPGAVRLLGTSRWPGNVRELAHALERAFLIGNGVITAKLLLKDGACQPQASSEGPGTLKGAVIKTERELLAQALAKAGGNKSSAARAVGMKLSTFRDKLARHRLG